MNIPELILIIGGAIIAGFFGLAVFVFAFIEKRFDGYCALGVVLGLLVIIFGVIVF